MTRDKINNLDDLKHAIFCNALDGEKIAQCDIRSRYYEIAQIQTRIEDEARDVAINLKGKVIVDAEQTDFGFDLYLSGDDGKFYRFTSEDGKLETLSRDLDRLEPYPF